MANIEFFTGFEGCASTDDLQSFVATLDNTVYRSTGGYDDGRCIDIFYRSGHFRINCNAAKTKVVGFHVKELNARSSYDSRIEYNLISFDSDSFSIVFHNSSTGLKVYRDETLIASCATVLPSTLQHIEIKVFSDSAAGTVQVKQDGETILDASSLNTGGEDFESIRFGCTYRDHVYYDNIFFADDWCGELKSYLLLPDGDDTAQFTPSEGSDNYAMVDDDGQDGDTTYVESATVGDKDIYTFSDLPSGVSPAALTLVYVDRKDGLGSRQLKTLAVQDAVEYALDQFAVRLEYPAAYNTAHFDVLNSSPDGSALDLNKVNAMKFGYEVA